MQRITVFGKGGIGKSTLSANLAAVYARRGLKVLLVGCDPKHDTTVALTDGRPIRTVVEQSAFMDSSSCDLSKILVRGRLGVDCVEAGGPEPGIGCAGRGIGRMITILEAAGVLDKGRYDVAVFDVLGDVVCGGFAAPLRQGFADKVVIVASEELMALYAANNIARAIRNYSDNGVVLCGLVGNLRDPGADREAVARLAGLIGTRVLSFFSREDAVRQAEYRHVTVVEQAPGCAMAEGIERLADELLAFDRSRAQPPTPLSDERFHELSRSAFVAAPPATAASVSAPPPSPADVPALAAPSAPGPGPDIEAELSRRANLWEGDPGLNSQVWGDRDQWRRFFCDFETRRHARTHLEVSNPVVNVRHQDLECSYATPDYHDVSLPSFYKFPWPRSQRAPEQDVPSAPARRRGRRRSAQGGFQDIMTDLRDHDVINGGARKLDDAIGSAVARAEGGAAKAVIVHSTCVPTVIGDDAASTVARWQRRTRIPIVYSNPAENGRCADAGLEIFKRMQKDPAFARTRKRKRAVNLVGFPEGPGLSELTGLLETAGVEVLACVMPSLDLEAARRYLAAEAQVLYPNAAYEATYREFFETMPIRSLRPEAPYGLEGTRLWLEAVAGLFSRKRQAREAFAEASRPLRGAWDAARREAAGHALAFIVDAPHMRRLSDPSQSWGVPLLRVLREMRFGVEVHCHGTARTGSGALSFFSRQEDLDGLLRDARFQAVYSEYAYDSRLARAAKAQFSLDCFEVGLAGALRTIDRLNRLCRWPFLRRYARFMGEG